MSRVPAPRETWLRLMAEAREDIAVLGSQGACQPPAS